ncbi:hypothetical protein PoB_000834000 [Plakobranchus ocellatus]|uniref:Uncharacterized protein n=1 Tax=Plakobranchus ocellatus TaxID=259542 RepID=A0AAV3YH45_9GAST|nr:hypothetical protein PoB_000834000 [Plakobranchus ocellatus]
MSLKTKDKVKSKCRLGIVTEKGVYIDLWIDKDDHDLLSKGDQLSEAENILGKYLHQLKNLPYEDDSCQSIKLEGWGLSPLVAYIADDKGMPVDLHHYKS